MAPDKREYPGPPGWGLGVRLTTSPRKKIFVTKTLQRASERNDYPTETKTARTDQNHGLDIWHMKRSDHVATREDDGDS